MPASNKIIEDASSVLVALNGCSEISKAAGFSYRGYCAGLLTHVTQMVHEPADRLRVVRQLMVFWGITKEEL